jgi:hypothetical protein
MLSALVLAADDATGSGGKDAGESASAWNAGGLLFWLLIVLVAVGVLVGVLLLGARRRPRATTTTAVAAGDGAGAPPPRRVEHVEPTEGWELAVLTFDGRNGAEQAFAGVRGAGAGSGWMRELAFAECHRHGRVVIRGTVGGRYVDEQDLAVAEGETPLLAELRADVPEGSSALVAYAPPGDVDDLVRAIGDRSHELHRHSASAAEVSALGLAVADAPAATAASSDGRRDEG